MSTDKKFIVCKKCKKDSDIVLSTALVGDDRVLNPNIRPTYSQYKCVRCEHILVANEKLFNVTPTQKTFRCSNCNQEYPWSEIKQHEENCLHKITDPNKRFKEKLKRTKRRTVKSEK